MNGKLFENLSPLLPSITLYDKNLNTDFTGTISIRPTKIMKGSVVTFGAITKDLLKSFNFKPPANWASAVHKTSLYYFNNKGISFG